MASCGTLTLCPASEKASERDHTCKESRRNKRWDPTVFAGLALALLVIPAGCAPTHRFGSPPRTDQLDKLKLSESTRPDVLLVLGQPQGDGVVRFPAGPTQRTIWLYDYSEVASRVMDLKTLLVFFDQDKYDGHLWFSSTQKLPEAPTVRRGALNRPDINALENSLRIGESTRAEVLAALGEPIGRGMARLPVDPRPNAEAMWSYYYTVVGVSGRMFLFVFFDEDRYDGYMWFSSLPK